MKKNVVKIITILLIALMIVGISNIANGIFQIVKKYIIV